MQSLSPQDRIDGRFVLEKLLSQGGVGSVWRAKQEPHGRLVALKLLRPEMAGLPHLRRRFAREARAASRLRHGNIAAVYEYGVDDFGRMFMSMELIDGYPLSRLIERGLSLEHVLILIEQVLAGLAHAHARGVVHRDLKPANIIVSGTNLPKHPGNAMIIDFGIATLLFDSGDGRDTEHGEVVGTPRYMSPEQASGVRTLTPRADLYNVGLLLYEFITGYPPFGEQKGLAVMSMHVHEPVPEMVPRKGLVIWPELRDFVMKALEKQPGDRWASATDMRVALQRLLEVARQDPQAQHAPQPLPPVSGKSARTLEESIVGRPVALSSDFIESEDGRFDLTLAGGFSSVFSPDVENENVYSENSESGEIASFQRIPFVGRPKERSFLRKLVLHVVAGKGGKLVILEGEAGVGKTRLTMWVKEKAEEHGLLHGHIGAFTRGSTGGLRGLQEVLESMFATRGLTRADVYSRVFQMLESWGQIAREDAQAITDFLRPSDFSESPMRDSRNLPGSPQLLYAAVTRAFELAALQEPRLIIFDDIHWAGAELADFFDYLAVELRHRSVPLMVIATARTEDMAENPQLENRLNALSRYTGETVERLALDRLQRASGFRLIKALLPVDDVLTDIVFERSGGNPLHLLLLLRYLQNEGLLEWSGDQWRARSVEDVRQAVPPSLADLFRVRIQQIEERYQTGNRLSELLHRAAVAGSRFGYDVLREMIQIEGNPTLEASFDKDLDRLLSEGLIAESHTRRDDWFTFSHALVRDYFLRDAGGPRNIRRLHKLAAQAMETVFGRSADTFALEIGTHWRAARVPEQALRWFLIAAETAQRSFMLRQASEAYEISLELMEAILGRDSVSKSNNQVLQDAESLPLAGGNLFAEYLETLVTLGDLYEGFGEFKPAENAYRKVVREVTKVGIENCENGRKSVSKSWLGLGHVAWQRGDFEAAEWAFQRVRELISDRAELYEIDESAGRGLARVAWHRGDYGQARVLAATSLVAAKVRGDSDGHAESLWLLGEIARMLGHGGDARRFYMESLTIYRAEELPAGIARNLLSMAQLARYQKNFVEAAQLYRQALGRYESRGDRRGQGHCYNGLGDVARFEKRFDDARKNYGRALDIYQGIGARYDVAVVYANLGLTAISLVDIEGAQKFISAARDIVADDDYPYLLAGIEYNLALVEALLGQDEESSVTLEKVLALARRYPIADLDYAQPLEQLGRLRADAGSSQEAITLWEKAGDIYRDLDLHDDYERIQAFIRNLK